MLDWSATLRKLIAGAAYPKQRRERRVPFDVSINVCTVSGVNYRGFCRDLSPFGMGALVSAPLEIGEQVRINYEHPTRGEQMASATVRQRHGYRYGFELQLPRSA